MATIEDSPIQENAEAPDSPQVMEEARRHRESALEAISQARQNIARGTALHTSSHGVVETPSDSRAIERGDTDALK